MWNITLLAQSITEVTVKNSYSSDISKANSKNTLHYSRPWYNVEPFTDFNRKLGAQVIDFLHRPFSTTLIAGFWSLELPTMVKHDNKAMPCHEHAVSYRRNMIMAI